MRKPQFKNLIFDWSGTLVDDFPPTLEATNAVFAHHGRAAMSEGEFRETFRLPYPEFYSEQLPGTSLEGLEIIFRTAFAASSHVVMDLEGAREILEWGRVSGVRLFVLSSMNEDTLDEQAGRLELRDFFEGIHAGVRDKRAEIGGILAQNDLVGEETAFIGDMVHDIESAAHGAVSSVAVLTGYDSEKRLQAAKPDFVFANLVEFLSWLQDAKRGDEMGHE